MSLSTPEVLPGHPSGFLTAGYLAVLVAALVRRETLMRACELADAQLNKRKGCEEVAQRARGGTGTRVPAGDLRRKSWRDLVADGSQRRHSQLRFAVRSWLRTS